MHKQKIKGFIDINLSTDFLTPFAAIQTNEFYCYLLECLMINTFQC